MTDWRPTPKQRAVLEAASEVGLRRTVSAVCGEAGVSRKTFYEWLNTDANFSTAWESVWHGTIRRYLPSVVSAMVERAQAGDVAAARLVADMAGVITQKTQQTGELRIIVERSDDPSPA